MGKKILVVDDSLTVRNIVESLLGKHGYEVLFVDDGANVLNTAQTNIPDIIFLNNSMSGLDGVQVLEGLKQSQVLNDVPVVMILSREEEKMEQDLREAGAEAVITKPFNPKEILGHVEKLLNKDKASGPEEEKKTRPGVSSEKGGATRKKDKATRTALPEEEIKADDTLNIVETSDLMDTTDTEMAHSFEWFVHELKKEAQESEEGDSHPQGKSSVSAGGAEHEKIELSEESSAYEISEQGKGFEEFVKDLKSDLGEPEKKRSSDARPEKQKSPSQPDQSFSELQEKICQRIAEEVAKKISPEVLERIIREETAKVVTDSS